MLTNPLIKHITDTDYFHRDSCFIYKSFVATNFQTQDNYVFCAEVDIFYLCLSIFFFIASTNILESHSMFCHSTLLPLTPLSLPKIPVTATF